MYGNLDRAAGGMTFTTKTFTLPDGEYGRFIVRIHNTGRFVVPRQLMEELLTYLKESGGYTMSFFSSRMKYSAPEFELLSYTLGNRPTRELSLEHDLMYIIDRKYRQRT